MDGLNWIKSSKDAVGVVTFYPPQPVEYDDISRCSQCGGLTQFKHFFPEILSLLEPEDLVPSFCSTVCVKEFVRIRSSRGR